MYPFFFEGSVKVPINGEFDPEAIKTGILDRLKKEGFDTEEDGYNIVYKSNKMDILCKAGVFSIIGKSEKGSYSVEVGEKEAGVSYLISIHKLAKVCALFSAFPTLLIFIGVAFSPFSFIYVICFFLFGFIYLHTTSYAALLGINRRFLQKILRSAVTAAS